MTCPICRRSASSFSSNFTIQNFIDIFNNTSLDEAKEVAIISDIAVRGNLNAEGSSSSSFASTESSPVLETRAHDEEHHHDEAESSTAAFSAAASSSSASSYQSVTK